MARTQPFAPAKCGAREAEYIASLRFTASAARIATTTGAPSDTISISTNCEAPAMTKLVSTMTLARSIPAAVATTPNNIPNGATTSMKGRPDSTPARKPRRNSPSEAGAGGLRSGSAADMLGSGERSFISIAYLFPPASQITDCDP